MSLVPDIVLFVVSIIIFCAFWFGATDNPVVAKYGKLPASGRAKRIIDIGLILFWIYGVFIGYKYMSGDLFGGYSPGFIRVAVCLLVSTMICLAVNKLRATFTALVGVLSYAWLLYLGHRYSVPFYHVAILIAMSFLYYLIGYGHAQEDSQGPGLVASVVKRKGDTRHEASL